MAQIRNQRKQDLLITTTFEKQMKRDKKDGVVSDMLATRAQEIKKELESAVIQALNDSRLVISELDNIEVEPNSNICPNFPKEIFNYTDRLTLLNEGLALYAEPDLDKDNLEYKLSRIISDTMSKLPNVKKDILYDSIELYDTSYGMPWYEWDILSNLLTGVNYDETMRKVDEYNESIRWNMEEQSEEDEEPHEAAKEMRDYHQGIVACHSLLDFLREKHLPHDENLVDVFLRLVYNGIDKLENPPAYFAELQKSKTYKQAIEDCCELVKDEYLHMHEIDSQWGDLRGITFDFIETIYRMLTCYLYNLAEDEKEVLSPADIRAMKLPFSDFDYLRIANSKNSDSCFRELPHEYLYSYVDKDEDWDVWKYNLPPLNDFD